MNQSNKLLLIKCMVWNHSNALSSPYIYHQFIILEEDTDAASAVKQMHDKEEAETIIVKNKNDEDMSALLLIVIF